LKKIIEDIRNNSRFGLSLDSYDALLSLNDMEMHPAMDSKKIVYKHRAKGV